MGRCDLQEYFSILYLGGDLGRSIDLGDLTASPWGDSVGGPLRALLEKVDAEVGEAGDCEFDLFKRTKTP